jgi:hypothetical protein
MGFNDAKSYGMINSIKNLAKKNFKYLFLGLSNNEFKDSDAKLLISNLPALIKNTE